MTSGQFSTFPLDSIVINRPERQRRSLENIEELAGSIARVGLIHPPVIERNGVLRVGERRVSACRMLGWTSISVQYVDELDEHELQLLELEENVRRVDLPWNDECLAIERYHQLRSERDENWTDEKTAEALGFSRKFIVESRGVARELLYGNTRVMTAPRKTVAVGIVKRKLARAREAVEHLITGPPPKPVAPILHEDFNAWSFAPYDGPQFNFVHCDFPYGIGADEFDQGSAPEMGGYDDDFATYQRLLSSLGAIMHTHIHRSAHLMFWFSMKNYALTVKVLEEMGWRIWYTPLIWHKSDNIGVIPDAKRGPRQVYETCLFGSRGDRHIVRAVSNLVPHSTTQSIHMSEKPEPMLRKFFEMFVDEYTVMLDPTCGSGSSLRAAKKLKAKHLLGLEINKEFCEDARRHFDD